MEAENRQTEIRRLELERCQALAEYHKAADKLDYIDYQLFKLKKRNHGLLSVKGGDKNGKKGSGHQHQPDIQKRLNEEVTL